LLPPHFDGRYLWSCAARAAFWLRRPRLLELPGGTLRRDLIFHDAARDPESLSHLLFLEAETFARSLEMPEGDLYILAIAASAPRYAR